MMTLTGNGAAWTFVEHYHWSGVSEDMLHSDCFIPVIPVCSTIVMHVTVYGFFVKLGPVPSSITCIHQLHNHCDHI